MPLIDPYHREIKYLRISVTDRCNLRCGYCMPPQGWHPEGKHSEYLSFDEIARIAKAFTNLGIRHIRLTGGEPLVRKNLHHLAETLKQLDSDNIDLALSTNAVGLARQADELFAAGITRLNISLDTLDAKKYQKITQQNRINDVFEGIQTAKKIGFDPIKINFVVMQGINDQEIEAMLDWCQENQLECRFIEVMPIGQSGLEQMKNHYPAVKIMQRIEKHFGSALLPTISKHGAGPAKYYAIQGSRMGVGLITAVSQHFCQTCNRVRLTSRGQLALCLGQEHAVDLRTPVRQGATIRELENILMEAIKIKPERHFFKENRRNIEFRQMVSIGG